jgi:hypothetical protein
MQSALLQSYQDTLTEEKGSVQLTSFVLASLDQLLLIMQTLFPDLQNQLS